MKKQLIIKMTELALADEDHQAWFFSRQSMELTMRFLEAAAATYADLADEPGMGSLYECDMRVLDGMRKKAIKGFPNHLVFYRVEGNALHVLRVLDGRRDLPKVIAWERNEEPDVAYSVPGGGILSKAQLEAELLKGLEGKGIPVNEAYWEDLRARISTRRSAKKGAAK